MSRWMSQADYDNVTDTILLVTVHVRAIVTAHVRGMSQLISGSMSQSMSQ